jgi:hypothetical protein
LGSLQACPRELRCLRSTTYRASDCRVWRPASQASWQRVHVWSDSWVWVLHVDVVKQAMQHHMHAWGCSLASVWASCGWPVVLEGCRKHSLGVLLAIVLFVGAVRHAACCQSCLPELWHMEKQRASIRLGPCLCLASAGHVSFTCTG